MRDCSLPWHAAVLFTVSSDWEAPQGSSRLYQVQIGELARGLRRQRVYIPPGASSTRWPPKSNLD